MNRGLCIAGGLLLGVAVGAGAVILFAPRSGADTRLAIQDRVNEILETGRQAGAARRQDLMSQFEGLKQPAPMEMAQPAETQATEAQP